VGPPDLAGYPWHRIGVPAAVECGSRIFTIYAFKNRGKPVGIALPAYLAVSDDVETRSLLIADCEQGSVVLCLLESFRSDAPQLTCPHTRWEARRKLGAIDQPVGLRIRANERGRK